VSARSAAALRADLDVDVARRDANRAKAPRIHALHGEALRVLAGLEGARRISVELIAVGLGWECERGNEIAPDDERELREVLGIPEEHGGEG